MKSTLAAMTVPWPTFQARPCVSVSHAAHKPEDIRAHAWSGPVAGKKEVDVAVVRQVYIIRKGNSQQGVSTLLRESHIENSHASLTTLQLTSECMV